MRYLIRSTKKFIIPALALALILTAAITVFCFITLRNTAVCNRIEIWSKDRYEADATYENMDEVAAALEDMGLGI